MSKRKKGVALRQYDPHRVPRRTLVREEPVGCIATFIFITIFLLTLTIL